MKDRNCLLFLGVVVTYILLIVSLSLLWVSVVSSSSQANIGVRVVRLMYDFKAPEDLVMGQSELKTLLVEEEFERLTVDNLYRAVNTYYKFGYTSSDVVIVDYSEGYVLYRLLNDNISSNTLWIFQYDVTRNGLLTNIREYEAIDIGYKEGLD